MVTGPFVAGNVNVTEATPEAFVVAITLVPLVVPFESVPADVVNSMPAPVTVPPDCPGLIVTVKGLAKAVPAAAD
jgi:hypothetical protein